MKDLFTGVLPLCRFVWRQERWRVMLWCCIMIIVNVLVVLTYTEIYPSAVERQAMAQTMRNPAMTFMLGPGYGLDDYTIGAMVGHEMLLFTSLAAAAMNILLVNVQTRSAEEDGRQELLLSLPVGRVSNLSALLVVSLLSNLGLALLAGVSMASLGVESVDFTGSLLYGLLLGVTGLFFAGLTALLAQAAESSRGSLGLAFSVLGLMYLVRGLGDLGREWLALVSPLGLILRAQVYVGNIWWPVFVMLVGSAVLWWGAFYFRRERDLGAGLIPSRPGRESASRLLTTPLALAFRLQRTTIIGWLCALFLLGLAYGSVFGDLELFLEGNEFLRDLLPAVQGYTLTEAFLGMVTLVMSMMAVIPALLTVLRLRREEKSGRLESLLALPVSRGKVLRSFVQLSIMVAIVAMLVSGLGLWLAVNAVLKDGYGFLPMLGASLAQLPGMLGIVAVAVFCLGTQPKYTGLAWAYLGYSFVAVYFGGLIGLPEWTAKLSSFSYNPQMPAEPFRPLIAALVLAVSLVLMAAGAVGYRRRDLGL